MSVNFDRLAELSTRQSPIQLFTRTMLLKTGLKGLISIFSVGILTLIPGIVNAQAPLEYELNHQDINNRAAVTKTKQAFSGLPIVVAVMAKVPPENEAAFMAIATKTKELAADDIGILSYDFYKQHNTEDLYLIFIEVSSRKALNKHLDTDHAQEFMAQLDRLVSEPVSSRVFTIRGTDFVLGF
ncbi:Antibiotic biosynthesis monooxygenase [Thalassoporum mexicanum PCC 7367]|uniref:putative quinol monooxygenase n=1 Tax=Thalassoporum mexicanum TaxID=3457544 RepID=UPI00029FC192|nr:antibiotic biosynthesis monooxygenase [Pseudanabaena sp. PCC 7367]AFY69935.1 Antibiotic biosynthesis monooxygenase [Pseudanabaena sp. PCC 7367]